MTEDGRIEMTAPCFCCGAAPAIQLGRLALCVPCTDRLAAQAREIERELMEGVVRYETA